MVSVKTLGHQRRSHSFQSKKRHRADDIRCFIESGKPPGPKMSVPGFKFSDSVFLLEHGKGGTTYNVSRMDAEC